MFFEGIDIDQRFNKWTSFKLSMKYRRVIHGSKSMRENPVYIYKVWLGFTLRKQVFGIMKKFKNKLQKANNPETFIRCPYK